MRPSAELPAQSAKQHDGDGPRHYGEISEHASGPQIVEIELHLAADVIDGSVVRLVDLRPARDPRHHPLTEVIVRDYLPKLRENRWTLGSWPDDVHVSLDHVDELRQLVEPGDAKIPAQRGHALVARCCPDFFAVGFRRGYHRAELVHRERPAAEIPHANVFVRRLPVPATIEPDADLLVEDRPSAGQL